jgi:hypothetical protein
MNLKRHLPALCIAAALACAGLASAQPSWAPAPTPLRDLYADVQALMRLVPLQLTNEQLDQLIAMYAQLDAEQAHAAYNEQTLQQLQLMRERLLAGEPLRPEDEVVLRGIYKVAGIERAERYDLDKLTPLLQKIITPEQLDRLADLSSRSAAYNLAIRRGIVVRELLRLMQAVPKPQEQWIDARNRCVEALVEEIADPAQKQAAREKLTPLLDNLRTIPLQELRQRADQVAYQIIEAVPEIGAASVARAAARRRDLDQLSEEERQRRRTRSLYIFAGRNIPLLLKEMKEARAASSSASPTAPAAQPPTPAQ